MTMPSSGPISLGQANTELGRSATATIDMNDAALRTLAGVGGSGTTWSMNSLYGKSFITISLASMVSIYGTSPLGVQPYAYYLFNSNGLMTYFTNGVFNQPMGNWASPTTAGVGSSYWIRFTQTSSSGSSDETGSARGVWISLSTDPIFGIAGTGGPGAYGERVYTVQIASDSGGSNILATTSVTIAVEEIF